MGTIFATVLCISSHILSYGAVYPGSEEPVNDGIEISWAMENEEAGAEYGYCEGSVGTNEAAAAWERAIHVSEPTVWLEENGNYSFFVKSGDQIWVETYTLSLIDKSPPKISVTILGTEEGLVSFKVRVSDANGIRDKRILEGSNGVEQFDEAESFSDETLRRPSGTYTVYARDRAGNIGVSEVEIEVEVEEVSAPSVNFHDLQYESDGTVTAGLEVSDYKEVRCIKGSAGVTSWGSASNENDLVLSHYAPGRYTVFVKATNDKIWAYPLILEGKEEAETSSEHMEEPTEWSTEYQTHGGSMSYEIMTKPTEEPSETQPPESESEPLPTRPEPDKPDRPDRPDRPQETYPPHEPETSTPDPEEPESVFQPSHVPHTLPPETETVPPKEPVGSVTVLPQTGGFDLRAVSLVLTGFTGAGGLGLYHAGRKRKKKEERSRNEEHKEE